MNVGMKPLNEVTRRAVEVLSREIGIVDTVRFINQFTMGYGDYTEERTALFKNRTLEDVLSALKVTRRRSAASMKRSELTGGKRGGSTTHRQQRATSKTDH
jgi:hypothetical protein